MPRTVNKIMLVGHVGRDPDVRETSSGAKVAHLSLATNRRVGEDGQERTDWHRLTMWNRLAQFAQDYVGRGDRIWVEGSLEYDSYERDGVTIPTADIRVRELVLLSPPKGDEVPVSILEAAIALHRGADPREVQSDFEKQWGRAWAHQAMGRARQQAEDRTLEELVALRDTQGGD